jgi:hypothetical protein
MNFCQEMQQQRWDDLRFYHQSYINQSLHLLSAIGFLISYALVFYDFTIALFFGWFVAMAPRQIGHFVFEPHDYDKVNQIEDDKKEAIKVGFNLHKKVWLISFWVAATATAYFSPTLLGLVPEYTTQRELLDHLAYAWAAVAVGGFLFRGIQLMFTHSFTTGFVWMIKIITEPLHNLPVYYKAPYYMLKGKKLDPMTGHNIAVGLPANEQPGIA